MRRRAAGLTLALLLAACEPAPFPESLRTDRRAFLEAVALIEEAGRDLQAARDAGEGPGDALARLEQGMRRGYRVREVFLDHVDPRLNTAWNQDLLPGVETYLRGARDGDLAAQGEGIRRVARWQRYWEAHREALLGRMRVRASTP